MLLYDSRGGHFTTLLVGGGGPGCNDKWTQSNISFCKHERSKRYKTMKNGVNKNENHGEHFGKMLQNGK